MALNIQFKKAVKMEARGRVALIGPAGSGKSYTALVLARLLAGPNGRIAAIDTEHGSLSKYADLFDFDVFELDSYSPENFQAAVQAAEQARYDVFLCDSLSHFWVGKDGALEFVDERAKRHRDQMGGWKDFRPHERSMVDAMIASPCHVIVTMRTKTAYEETVGNDGKKKRVKIGLAPVQREGLEYEFDLVGYMDDENVFNVDKTRCPAYTQRSLTKPGPKEFAAFVEWLKGARREPHAPPANANPPVSPARATPPAAPAASPAPAPPAREAAAPEDQTKSRSNGGKELTLPMLLDSMRDFKSCLESVEMMRTLFLETLAPSELQRVFAEFKMNKPNEFRTVANAKACVTALWNEWRAAQSAPRGDYAASDDDLPPGLFREPAPTPYDEVRR